MPLSLQKASSSLAVGIPTPLVFSAVGSLNSTTECPAITTSTSKPASFAPLAKNSGMLALVGSSGPLVARYRNFIAPPASVRWRMIPPAQRAGVPRTLRLQLRRQGRRVRLPLERLQHPLRRGPSAPRRLLQHVQQRRV